MAIGILRKAAAVLSITILSLSSSVHADEQDSVNRVKPRLSTDEVENQIALDRESNPLYESKLLAPLHRWKSELGQRTGFNWSIDYSALFMTVSDSLGEDSSSSGVARFFGYWDLVNRDSANKGSLNWKIEHRHRYSDIPPSALGFESGYAGLFEPTFSNQEGRLTNVYWKQYLANGKWATVLGFLDSTDFVDVYLLASPWTAFNNFVFSTGSASMDLPNDATLGVGAGGMITNNIYIQAGLTDANSDPTEPFDGFDSVSSDSDFFKWVEIGYTPGQDKIYFDNIHVTFWHVDERVNGTPDGWGINGSWQMWIDDKWLPFIRGGYTEDSGSLLEKSLTFGLGYQPVPMRGVIGLGFNWGEPNPESFGDVDDQITTELFWRYQFSKEVAITPSIQYLKDPALNENEDDLWAFGLRMRFAL